MALKYLKLIISLFVISLLTNASVDSPFVSSRIGQRIVDEVAKLRLNVDIPILSAEVAEGINLSTNYNYEVYPSFINSMFTRIDGWELDVNLSAGDIIKDQTNMPLSFGINRGSKVLFVRHFEKQLDAATATPYTLAKLPLSAEVVKNKLNSGDFVSMPAELTLSLGASTGNVQGIHSFLSSSSASFRIFLGGKFIVQVLRMKDNKARLRLITEASGGTEVNLSHGVTSQFFGISYIDNKINAFHPLVVANFGGSVTRGKQYILDYVFDLNSNAAIQAYNNILSSRFKMKDLMAARSLVQRGQMQSENIASLEQADQVFAEDKERLKSGRADAYRVQRIFKGSNVFRRNNFSYRLNLLFFESSGNNSFAKNQIHRINGANEKSEFNFQVKRTTRQRARGVGYRTFLNASNETFFSMIDDKKSSSYDVYPDFGFSHSLRELKFNRAEQGRFFRSLAGKLPGSLFSQMKWKGTHDVYLNSAVNYRLIIKGEFLSKIPVFHTRDYSNRLRFFNHYKEYLVALKAGRGYFGEIPQQMNEVSFLTTLYKIIYKSDWTAAKRQQKLMSLRNDEDFRERGIGFLFSMFSYEELVPYISFSYSFEGENQTSAVSIPDQLTAGDQSINGLFDQITDVQNTLEDRGFDLRLAE